MSTKIRVIDHALLARLVPMSQAIFLMRSAFAQISHKSGKAQVPIRIHLQNKQQTESLYMPVILDDCETYGIKIVGMNAANMSKNLPFISATVLLMDRETGGIRAFLDGSYITALRTGAASGLATDLLALPEADTLAIFGTGKQAVTQLEAVVEVRKLQKVLIFNRTPQHAQAFAAAMHARFGIEMIVASAPEQVREAQIICTATTSSKPVFDAAHISAGTHINAVGAYREDMAEIPSPTVQDAQIVVDQLAASLKEAGDLIQPLKAGLIKMEDLQTELGHIVLGEKQGRTRREDITLFKSVGNAAQDLVVAEAAWKAAEAQDAGISIPWSMS
ncbi:MAG: ornithine cyclodeaminase [Bacteroidota bacterium]